MDLQAGRLDELPIAELVGPPESAVGEHTQVALAGLALPGGDVAGELGSRGRGHALRAQVLLYFDDGEPDLDVDPPSVPDLRLQLHVQLVLFQVQSGAEQELPHVGLDRGFAAQFRPVREPPQDRCQPVGGRSRCGHGAVLVTGA